jgi:hypothetical protein
MTDTEPAASTTTTPMATESEVTRESYEAALARTKELEAKLAQSEGARSVYEDRERVKVKSFEDSAKWFFKEFLPEGQDAEVVANMAPLGTWADEMAQKKEIAPQLHLAQACHVASAKFKRLREEASVHGEAKETLGKTMKENEELKADISNKAQRIVELESLATERQQQAEKLQAELAKHGLIAEKYNFSKLTAREEGAAKDTDGDAKMDDAGALSDKAQGKQPAAEGSMTAVTANASRGRSANPFDGDPLAAMIASRGSGHGKLMASGTQHAFLGAQDASGDIAALLKVQ